MSPENTQPHENEPPVDENDDTQPFDVVPRWTEEEESRLNFRAWILGETVSPTSWQEQNRESRQADFNRRLSALTQEEKDACRLPDLMLWEAFEDGEIALTSVEAHDLKVKLFGSSDKPLQIEPPELTTEYSIVGRQALRRSVARLLRRLANSVYAEAS